MIRACVVMVMVGGSACLPLNPLFPCEGAECVDAGTSTGGGSATGGGTTSSGGGTATGGGSATGGGTSSTGGGTATGGGSPTTGGGSGSLPSFGLMALSYTGTSSSTVIGLGENDAGLFALDDLDRFYQLGSSGFTQLGTGPASPRAFKSLSSGTLAAITNLQFHTCTTNCGNPSSWSPFLTGASSGGLTDFCELPNGSVLLVGSTPPNGNSMWIWNGSSVSGKASLSISGSPSCFVSPNGTVFIMSSGTTVDVYDGALSSQTLPSSVTLWGGGSAAGNDYVTGGDATILKRSGTSWTQVFTATSPSVTLYAVIDVPSGPLAVGTGSRLGYSFDGSQWNVLAATVPTMDALRGSLHATSGDWYLAGRENNTPRIIRVRP